MKLSVLLGMMVFSFGCVSLKERMSCETDVSDMGFVECDSPEVTACGVTLLNCEDGASYYCVTRVVCDTGDKD